MNDDIYKPDLTTIKKQYQKALKKNPNRKEEITVDLCNMLIRNDLFNVCDVILTFGDIGISEKELFTKYHVNKKGVYKR